MSTIALMMIVGWAVPIDFSQIGERGASAPWFPAVALASGSRGLTPPARLHPKRVLKESQAEPAFSSGDYAAAAKLLDEAVTQRPDLPATFFLNQGNAHFLAGNTGAAILAYRRAERLSPMDQHVRENLAAARSRVLESHLSVYPRPPWWRNWLRFSGWLAFAGHLLACLAFLRGWWTRLWPRSLLLFMLTGWSLAGAWATGLLLDEIDASRKWVVVTADTLARQGNGMSYPLQEWHGRPVTLRQGVEGKVIVAKDNGWVLIELAEGLRCWVPARAVAFVSLQDEAEKPTPPLPSSPTPASADRR